MHWWGDSVYSSELGFLLDFPYLITHSPAQRNTKRFRAWLFAARIGLNTVGCAAVTEGHALWWGVGALAISAALHAVSYAHASRHRLRVATPGNGRLFLLAHVGVLNFVFQLPGRGVPAVRLTRTLQLFVTLTVGLVFAFTLTTITPLEDAWGCYVPAHVVSLANYNHGTCDVPNAPACRMVPVVNCGVAHGAIFSAELHYATQVMIVSFVVYITGSVANWDAHFGA